jgi:hypothetical protein
VTARRFALGNPAWKTLLAVASCPWLFTVLAGGLARASTAVSACRLSALNVSASNEDGLHHGVELITFKNETASACTMHGCPDVDAVLLRGTAPSNLRGMYRPSSRGSTLSATDAEVSWAGGVNWSTGVGPSAAAQKGFAPPTITLPARTGAASSTLNWIDGPNGTGTCLAFETIRIGIGGTFVAPPLVSVRIHCAMSSS